MDETRDAHRRTNLANERTFLAWWRSGLTALGLSVAIGRVVPELSHTTKWPFVALGAVYGILGIAMVLFGTARQRRVEEAIERGELLGAERRALAVFTVFATLIALATLALVLAGA